MSKKPIFIYAQKASGESDEYMIESFGKDEVASLQNWIKRNLKSSACLSMTDNRYFAFTQVPAKVRTRIKCDKLNVSTQQTSEVERVCELLKLFLNSKNRFCFLVKG